MHVCSEMSPIMLKWAFSQEGGREGEGDWERDGPILFGSTATRIRPISYYSVKAAVWVLWCLNQQSRSTWSCALPGHYQDGGVETPKAVAVKRSPTNPGKSVGWVKLGGVGRMRWIKGWLWAWWRWKGWCPVHDAIPSGQHAPYVSLDLCLLKSCCRSRQLRVLQRRKGKYFPLPFPSLLFGQPHHSMQQSLFGKASCCGRKG